MATPIPKVIDDGGPAFPFKCQGATTAPEFYYGMTLRDYFAAKALQGMLSDLNTVVAIGFGESDPRATTATTAYKFADAMLAARKAVRS